MGFSSTHFLPVNIDIGEIIRKYCIQFVARCLPLLTPSRRLDTTTLNLDVSFTCTFTDGVFRIQTEVRNFSE
jgi:hypothetical protein